MMLALDAGAEDFVAEEEVFILQLLQRILKSRETLEAEGLEFLEA